MKPYLNFHHLFLLLACGTLFSLSAQSSEKFLKIKPEISSVYIQEGSRINVFSIQDTAMSYLISEKGCGFSLIDSKTIVLSHCVGDLYLRPEQTQAFVASDMSELNFLESILSSDTLKFKADKSSSLNAKFTCSHLRVEAAHNSQVNLNGEAKKSYFLQANAGSGILIENQTTTEQLTVLADHFSRIYAERLVAQKADIFAKKGMNNILFNGVGSSNIQTSSNNMVTNVALNKEMLTERQNSANEPSASSTPYERIENEIQNFQKEIESKLSALEEAIGEIQFLNYNIADKTDLIIEINELYESLQMDISDLYCEVMDIQSEMDLLDYDSDTIVYPDELRKELSQLKYEYLADIAKLNAEIKILSAETPYYAHYTKNILDIDQYIPSFKKKKNREKFKGHWMGLEFGFAYYTSATKGLSVELPDNYRSAHLNYSKSGDIAWNVFQYSIGFDSPHWGLVTGAGFQWHIYRFDDPRVRITKNDGFVSFTPDTDPLKHFYKSRLYVSYFRIPILFEYNSAKKFSSFHVSLGLVPGVKMCSWTKQQYELISNGNKGKNKEKDDYYINPFKLDVVSYIGFGPVSAYFSYSPTRLFLQDKGPALYPFAFGVLLSIP